MKVLIQPPTFSYGSLGDEAMLLGAMRALPDADRCVLAERGTRVDWRQYDRFILIGADCVDGAYGTPPLQFAWQAIAAGVETRIVSFSVRQSALLAPLAALSQAGVELWARDSITQSRLHEQGIDAQWGGDLAVLCPDAVSTVLQASPSGVRIAICPTDRRECPAAALAKLPPSLLVLVPHDRRRFRGHGLTDLEAAQTWQRQLVDQTAHQVIIAEPAGAQHARSIAAACDLAFSCRLHFALACLSQGTPAVGIAYQGKFEGLYRDLGVSPLLPRGNDLGEVLLAAWIARRDHAATLAETAPQMAERARRMLA